MSRCFPYPPPGYTLIRDSDIALIESIKPQNETGKDQKKKEKTEKKKKDKTLRPSNTERQINGKMGPGTNGKLVEDYTFKAETESLERSDLSVEHGLPVKLLVPSCSSDSTENSNNRKRSSSPIVSQPKASGKIIRIRLSKKQYGSDSLGNEQNPCSTSGRVNVKLPTSYQIEAKSGVLVDRATRKKNKACLKYINVMEKWVKAPLQAPQDDDLDWLLKSKNVEPHKRQKTITETLPCSMSELLGVYALPYTVPF